MKILKIKKIIAAVAVSCVLMFGCELPYAIAFNSGFNVNIEAKGSINWNKGSDSDVTAVGISRPDPRGMAMSREAAIMAAQRNLIGIVQGMQINSTTTMRDLIIADDNVNRKISGTLRGAQIIEEEVTNDGGYYVKMRVPIYGVGESIAAAVIPALRPSEPQAFNVPNLQNLEPSIIQDIQYGEYSGIVVDASGLGLAETFSPVIYDTSGRAIYGIENLQNDALIIGEGMVSYSKSVNDATAMQRAGNAPLIVKAVSVRGGNNSVNKVNVVISSTDADKILLANQKTHMLENCAVVFVE
jgi:hypothetical protein